ncbi:MAG: ABC transporter substrate-binding protein [Candidatus Humimicrobiaceae bacterium]
MKKLVLWVIVLSLVFSLVASISFIGCKSASTTETTAAATTQAAETTQAVETTQAAAFNWKKFEGTKIGVLLDKHPYADRIVAELPEFETLTGIKVKVDEAPEAEYHDKVLLALSSGSKEFDVIMTGIMDVWSFAPAGYITPLDSFLSNKDVTSPDYQFEDIFEKISGASRWDKIDGHKTGTGEQWAIPIGFEQMSLFYRADLFKKYGVKVPETVPEMTAAAKLIQEKEPGMYGFAARGNRFWGTIHTAPISLLANYGGTDFTEDLQPAMGSPEGIQFHKDYIELLQTAGPKGWTNYDWYDIQGDMALGKAVMSIDADILGSFAVNQDDSVVKTLGMVNWAPVPTKTGGDKHMGNLWIWNLSINASSEKQDAAWYFIQWATGKEQILKSAMDYSLMDPVRQSVWEMDAFKTKINATYETYIDTFLKNVPNSAVLFTPQAAFAERVTEWAAALQEMYEGANVEQRLDKLVKDLTLK